MSIRDITVVITSFRSDEKIISCLNSIDRQCKVIVVENSNDFKIKEKIEKSFNNVTCFLAGQNLGYAKGNNFGLKKVLTKYALILNPDALLERTALENFLKFADHYPNFSIAGPYIQNYKKKEINLKVSNPIEVKNIKGFAMFLNLEKFKDIGYFDENFFIYFEEIDLCMRISNLNKKIYLVPSIIINHEGAQSHDKSINREMELSRNWHWMWSTFYYHRKYKGYFVSFLIILPKLLSSILKIVFYSIFKNKEKKDIYYQRYSGLISAIKGKSSWYRPKV